jgi:glycerol uptake operon antiterminator
MLTQFTIIPSVRNLKYFEDSLKTSSKIIFLSEAHIGSLTSLAKKCHERRKIVFVNIDLIGGISKDQLGIKFLKDIFKVDGIISASSRHLNMAKNENLFTIQRFFLLDSRAFDSSMDALKTSKIDAVEILPGPMAARFSAEIKLKKDIPLLAGGFIRTVDSLKDIYQAGFMGVTTSERNLWDVSSLK